MKKNYAKKKTCSTEHRRFLRRRNRNRIIVRVTQVALLGLFVGLWQLLADVGAIDVFITSSPQRVCQTFAKLAEGDLWRHVWTTLYETTLSFALSFAIGTTVAVLLWFSETVRRVIEPYLVVLNALPKIALGPIIIIWVGAGVKAIVAMAILISVVITTINTLTGFVSVSEEKILLMRTLHATKWQTLWKLVFPANIPTVMSCLKVSVGMSWVGTIMGEYLVSKAGLGYLIVYGGQVFNLSLVMCATVLLCLLAAAMYLGVALLEKAVNRKIGQ